MKNFGRVPSVRYTRSKFDLSHGVKTTMSVGKLYPVKCLEVLPGDSFKSVMTAVSRCTSSFLKPIIDNLYMDVHHFFVPLRLLYDDAEKVFGNPQPSAYTDNNLSDFPYFDEAQDVSSGTVADYLGLPLTSDGKKVKAGCSVLPFRAFAKIYNDWFRNENTVDEVLVQRGELQASEALNNNAWSPSNYTGQLPYVGKKKDYFTSCLPNVQKGESVPIPLGTFVPVGTYRGNVDIPSVGSSTPLKLRTVTTGGYFPAGYSVPLYAENATADSGNDAFLHSFRGSAVSNGESNYSDGVAPTNLYADLTKAIPADISQLRTAFQLQKMLEKDARYGSRYNEFLLGHFGVTSPDARLQFSEYLGGGRIPIGVQQVSQTSAPSETSPLGAVGANSQSVGRSRYSKGFVEHGFVFTVACIRQLHTYQQGIPRLFFRHKREDFYDPLLANISEQPVYKAQLYGLQADSLDTSDITSAVFGYNEAWADYRYEPSIITGQLRSGIANSLDIWHLADYYDSAPTLGQDFTDENSENIDRVLSVETATQDNFLVDMWFNVSAVRVMPVYSVPGLVDHH